MVIYMYRASAVLSSNSNLDSTTWSPILHQAVSAKELGVIPFSLHLDYDYWTYRTYVVSKNTAYINH
jgi:hypothetical protein